MTQKIKIAIVGLGNRGKDAYAPAIKKYAGDMELAAIADIVPEKVDDVAADFGVPREMCFTSAEELLKQERLADVLFICTQDRQHVPHAIPALKKGYHLLLEKPISPDLDECRSILQTASECGRRVVVCHVLRYTPFYVKLKQIIDSAVIGDIVSVQAIENVAYYHQAHSFVRGNWRDSNETSPMILQKCCHDMDMLLWLTGKTCKTVSSFGSLSYFNEAHAPQGSALRCLDGCLAKENCPYDAEKIYITDKDLGVAHGHTAWPLNTLSLHPSVDSITQAIQEGPYGRCVFHCDNNVVDHQVINLNMEDGATVSFTMCAFTKDCSRYTKLMGTLGEIKADMHTNLITVAPFGKENEVIDVTKLADDFSGHGGGDIRMVREYMTMLQTGSEPGSSMTSLDRSIESHYIALAAEQSRLAGGTCIQMDDMRQSRR